MPLCWYIYKYLSVIQNCIRQTNNRHMCVCSERTVKRGRSISCCTIIIIGSERFALTPEKLVNWKIN